MSVVTQEIQDQVSELYIAFFNRAPDADGFGYWAQELASGRATVEQVAAGFGSTPEFIGMYGGLTPEQQVTRLYNNVLNRAPDADGLEFWVTALENGKSITDIAWSIVNTAFTGGEGVDPADTALVQNKVAVAEYFAIELDSNDVAIARTAFVGVTDDEATVTAAEERLAGEVNPPVTYTLTTAIETVPATGVMAGGSVVTGVIAVGANTYQTGDTINGNTAGTPSNVNVTISAGGAAGALVDVNNIQAVTFRTLAANNIDALLFTNVATVASSGSNAILTVDNGALASTYAVSNSIASTPNLFEGMTVNVRAGDITGTADTINFSVSGVGSVAGANTFRSLLNSNTTGVEGIAVATSGTNYFAVQGNTTAATDSRTLTLTGSGTNSVQIAAGALATTSNINGSALTGNLTLDVTTNVTSNDTITGGEGTADILQMQTGGAATGVRVSGFETLRVAEGSVGTILFGGTAPNFATIQVAGAAVATTNATFGSVGAPTTIYYRGNGSSVAANLAALEAFGNLSLNSSFSGSSDTVAVNIDNRGVAKNAGVGVTVGNLLVNGVEALNYTAADITSTGLTTLGTIGSNTLQSATFVTPGALTVGTITGGATGTISVLDFTGVVGNLTTAANAIAAGSLANGAVVTLGGSATTTNAFTMTSTQGNATSLNFVGGAGADTISVANLGTGTAAAIQGGGGADVLTGGGGADILEGGAGNDALAGGGGADTIDGGAGNDNITGGAGADLLTGGAGTDQFSYVSLATIAAQTGTTVGTVDVISDFTTGADTIQIGVAGTALNTEAGAAYATLAAAVAVNLSAGDIYRVDAVGAGTSWTAYLLVDTTAGGGTAADAVIQLGNAGAFATAAAALASFVPGDIIV